MDGRRGSFVCAGFSNQFIIKYSLSPYRAGLLEQSNQN